MDDIQNVIADVQYGVALRHARNVLPAEHFRDPGRDFDHAKFAALHHVTLQSALAEPLGGFFLSQFLQSNGSTQEDMLVLECLLNIRDFKRSVDANAAELAQSALLRLPPTFYRLKSFGILSILRRLSGMSVGVGEPRYGSGEAKTTAMAVDIPEENEDLARLEAQLREALSQHWDPFQKSAQFERYIRLTWYAEQRVSLENFTIFRDLGRGAFGVVSAARFDTTGAMMAIKQMNKKLVKGKRALRHVRTEKAILEVLGERPSPFTISLQYSWADEENFYLAMPLATGGDVAYHLACQGFFPVERARFTAAEVILGLEHLHSLGIVYRDLKPENILLDNAGHARISDMGLAVQARGKPVLGVAGTPGYWAPEVLKRESYGEEVDWWSFGCMVYEFLGGKCPFSKENTGIVSDNATLFWDLQFPSHCNMTVVRSRAGRPPPRGAPPFPDDARDLIRKLLNRDPLKRLGYGWGGADAIKAHPFFSTIDWARLLRRQMEPPWAPHPLAIYAANQSTLDQRNSEFTYRKLTLTDADDITDFSYVSTFKHQQDMVAVLELESQGKLNYCENDDAPSGCCAVS